LRRSLALVTLFLLAGADRPVSAAGFDLRVGGFFPRANGSLFQDDRSLYFVDPSKDFRGVYGGLEVSMKLAENLELGFSLDGYGRGVDTSYRDYERDNGDEIFQRLELGIVPLGVSLRFVPTSRRAKVAPYLAVGGDLVFWRYREFGDFVDFGDPDLGVVSDAFEARGVQGGLHGAVGIRVALSRDFSLVGEGRYLWAPLETMGDDFAPSEPGLVNEIDLSGFSVTIGVHIRF